MFFAKYLILEKNGPAALKNAVFGVFRAPGGDLNPKIASAARFIFIFLDSRLSAQPNQSRNPLGRVNPSAPETHGSLFECTVFKTGAI